MEYIIFLDWIKKTERREKYFWNPGNPPQERELHRGLIRGYHLEKFF